MILIERLRALGLRRAHEGIYTDQNICELAIEKIQELERQIKDFNTPVEIPPPNKSTLTPTEK